MQKPPGKHIDVPLAVKLEKPASQIMVRSPKTANPQSFFVLLDLSIQLDAGSSTGGTRA